MREVILFSGGMDSLIGWFYLGKPQAVYFDLNHRYRWKEMEALRKMKEIDPSVLVNIVNAFNLGKYEKEDAHIPFRNRLLVMAAAMEYPIVEKIYLVAQKGEQSIPDRSPEFFKDMSEMISKEMERKVEVVNPFPHMTKVAMVKWYRENVSDIELLRESVGCFDGASVTHCGKCSSCFRRSVAFEANNIPLDVMWSDIKKWSGIPGYIEKMKSGLYEADRTKETLDVLKKWGYEV